MQYNIDIGFFYCTVGLRMGLSILAYSSDRSPEYNSKDHLVVRFYFSWSGESYVSFLLRLLPSPIFRIVFVWIKSKEKIDQLLGNYEH